MGERVTGNTRLIEYGIMQEDRAIIRAHVAIGTGLVYIFSVGAAQDTLSRKPYREATAKQGQFITAKGKLVPPCDIADLVSIEIPAAWRTRALAYEKQDEGKKGQVAVEIMKHILKSGLLPSKFLTFVPQEITDEMLQVQGLDIIITATTKMQVKCDWRAGDKASGGTGNLYLQTHECNPYQKR